MTFFSRISPSIRPLLFFRSAVLSVLFSSLVGCAGFSGKSIVLAQDERFAVVVAGQNDTLGSLAGRYLGDPALAWKIQDFNGIDRLAPGQEIVIPLVNGNPTGVRSSGYQVVPVLCYHRFGSERHKMVVSPARFREQMAFLKREGYRVVRLEALKAFLEGRGDLPERAVVITVDDGYRSFFDVAYPILRSFDYPATLFVYSDFVGAPAGLTREQLRHMAASGLIDIQPHSKTHSHLGRPEEGESKTAFSSRVSEELAVPRRALAEFTTDSLDAFAYPYGASSDEALSALEEQGYRMALTVTPGGNAAYAYPLMLRRTMIFGDHTLADFERRLKTFEPMNNS
ncbi:MAG: polysaccharide deacetylase family protein [Pseudomonadota bacterium]|nr:polysaccharide deacetylase family protein [Pseudomonadota bacterium]